MAEASLHILMLDKKEFYSGINPMISHINIGTGRDITIKETAEIIKEVVGFKGEITFDTSRPDGVLKKLTDISRLSNMGWNYSTDLKEGLKMTYDWFLKKNEFEKYNGIK